VRTRDDFLLVARCHHYNADGNGDEPDFYPRDAMLARVFATATCPDVRPSVRHTPVLCENGAF